MVSLPATSHLLIALAPLLGCGTDASPDDPAPSSPHELQDDAAGRPVRGLGPALEIGIDPYVLDVGPNSATLAWTTRAAERDERCSVVRLANGSPQRPSPPGTTERTSRG